MEQGCCLYDLNSSSPWFLALSFTSVDHGSNPTSGLSHGLGFQSRPDCVGFPIWWFRPTSTTWTILGPLCFVFEKARAQRHFLLGKGNPTGKLKISTGAFQWHQGNDQWRQSHGMEAITLLPLWSSRSEFFFHPVIGTSWAVGCVTKKIIRWWRTYQMRFWRPLAETAHHSRENSEYWDPLHYDYADEPGQLLQIYTEQNKD